MDGRVRWKAFSYIFPARPLGLGAKKIDIKWRPRVYKNTDVFLVCFGEGAANGDYIQEE